MGDGRVDGTAALEEAYRLYSGRVFQFLLRRTHDADDAADLMQSTFADAAATLGDPSRAQPRSVLAWLYAIADRRFVDDVRRRTVARRRLRLLVRRDEVPDAAYSRQIADALRRTLESLPDSQRHVVVMKVLEGRSFAEISRALGVSEAACKMRMSRAVARIQETLAAEGIGPDA